MNAPDHGPASNIMLEPKGVAVVIEAAHQCMTTRGVHKTGVTMVTSAMHGAFRDDPSTRREFLAMIRNHAAGAEVEPPSWPPRRSRSSKG